MAFAAGFFTRGRKPSAQNNSDDFISYVFFVAGLGLFPMAFAVGFTMHGRKPAGPNNSEDFTFVVLFRCRAWLVPQWPLRLCLGFVLHAWAQTGGPELFGRVYFCFAVSWPGLACAPMAFAAGFCTRGRELFAQNNSEDFIVIMLFRGRAWFVSYGLCG